MWKLYLVLKSDNFNQLTPNQNYQLNGDFTDCTSSGDPTCSTRNSSFEFTSKGMLNKIIYPTGGYTRFEFELNDYSKRLEGKSVNQKKQPNPACFVHNYEFYGIFLSLRI